MKNRFLSKSYRIVYAKATHFFPNFNFCTTQRYESNFTNFKIYLIDKLNSGSFPLNFPRSRVSIPKKINGSLALSSCRSWEHVTPSTWNGSLVFKEGETRLLLHKRPRVKSILSVFLSKPINIAVTACALFRGLSLSLSAEWCTHACVSSHPRPPPTSP